MQTIQLWQFAHMTEEPKDVRLPFMVTASEAKAIDEWRYANRIPSRAEAMRILINRGLTYEDVISATNKLVDAIFPVIEGEQLLSEVVVPIAETVIELSEITTKPINFEQEAAIARAIERLEKIKPQ